MSKAIKGAEMLAGAVALGATAFFLASTGVGLAALPYLASGMTALVVGGAGMEVGAIADALTSNRGMNITTRQAAGFRQIGYGCQRVGGTLTYDSTTGSHHDQFNKVFPVYTHSVYAIDGIYLDGRQVFFDSTTHGSSTRNGVTFGGHADGNDHVGPNGQTYNFGGLVYAEARFGDETDHSVMTSLQSNDPTWSPANGRTPYGGGCCWIYMKVEDDATMFPQQPEIRITVRGRDTVYDPRTQTRGYSENPALIVADILCDPVYGLGHDYATEINEPQLIAAANVCDELVPLANGQSEARYTAHHHYDTSVGPGDAINVFLQAMAGRISRVGGEWFIWPAYWQGPSFQFDANALTGPVKWEPFRALRDRCNRITGTYTAPQYPYSVAGNWYDTNGFGPDGTREDVFSLAFQTTSFPAYAQDTLHGYAADQWLANDSGVILPREVSFQGVMSLGQVQRLAKIMLLRNRHEGTGTLPMSLAAWGMMPTSVMQMNFPQFLGWSNKVLEVGNTRFVTQEMQEVQAVTFEVDVNETGPEVYEWSTTEELTIYARPAAAPQAPYIVAPPTALAIATSTSTGNNPGVGGNSTNYALVLTWTDPLDGQATGIQANARPTTSDNSGDWFDGGTAAVGVGRTQIYGINHGQKYDVRIRTIRANGGESAWVEQDGIQA